MNEMIIFKTEDDSVSIDVRFDPGEETVWLTANQMAELFGRDEKTIRKHINNVFEEGELIAENNTQKLRVDGVKQNTRRKGTIFNTVELQIRFCRRVDRYGHLSE